METIVILAEALAKAAKLDVLRLDIQYNNVDEISSALCVLGHYSNLETRFEYIICEDGTIRKRVLYETNHRRIKTQRQY